MATLKNTRDEVILVVTVVSEANRTRGALGGRRVTQTHSHTEVDSF